jgi:hypothetical protein
MDSLPPDQWKKVNDRMDDYMSEAMQLDAQLAILDIANQQEATEAYNRFLLAMVNSYSFVSRDVYVSNHLEMLSMARRLYRPSPSSPDPDQFFS